MKLAGPRTFYCFAYVFMIDHIHLLTDQRKPPSDVMRIIKGITARRVIDYLKENDYTSSIEKLRHEVRNRNHRYSLWQMEKKCSSDLQRGNVYAEGQLHSQQSSESRIC